MLRLLWLAWDLGTRRQTKESMSIRKVVSMFFKPFKALKLSLLVTVLIGGALPVFAETQSVDQELSFAYILKVEVQKSVNSITEAVQVGDNEKARAELNELRDLLAQSAEDLRELERIRGIMGDYVKARGVPGPGAIALGGSTYYIGRIVQKNRPSLSAVLRYVGGAFGVVGVLTTARYGESLFEGAQSYLFVDKEIEALSFSLESSKMIVSEIEKQL